MPDTEDNAPSISVVPLAKQAASRQPPPGQYNLFTSELDPLPGESGRQSEEVWLFDPDFGLVLPDDPAGKEAQ